MNVENRFEERYKTGDIPWDHGTPDTNLVEMVNKRPIQEGKALEVGCGTGDNAIWLAGQNFAVTGCDISSTAIEKAKEKSSISKVNCSFITIDFLNSRIPGSPFDFVFDRGCLHSFDRARERKQFAEKAASYLIKGGLWLTLVGRTDDQPREIGPPQLTARELVTAVEPYFDIISLAAGHFGSNQSDPPKAWICLLQKREE